MNLLFVPTRIKDDLYLSGVATLRLDAEPPSRVTIPMRSDLEYICEVVQSVRANGKGFKVTLKVIGRQQT